MKYVKIIFNAPVFDRVPKDSAAKFVDKLSAVGRTMGLLTGFCIIIGIGIAYFVFKTLFGYLNIFREKAVNGK